MQHQTENNTTNTAVIGIAPEDGESHRTKRKSSSDDLELEGGRPDLKKSAPSKSGEDDGGSDTDPKNSVTVTATQPADNAGAQAAPPANAADTAKAATNEGDDKGPKNNGTTSAATATQPAVEAGAQAAPLPKAAVTAKAAITAKAAVTTGTGTAVKYLTDDMLNSNDVLLGRGSHLVKYEGNVRFRELVLEHQPEYVSNVRHHVKDHIAREVIATIAARKGRFLRKVESPDEMTELGIPTQDEDGSANKQVWVQADEAAMLEKVKQAFRDRCKRPASSLQNAASASNVALVAAAAANGNSLLSSAFASLQGQHQAGGMSGVSDNMAAALWRRQQEMSLLSNNPMAAASVRAIGIPPHNPRMQLQMLFHQQNAQRLMQLQRLQDRDQNLQQSQQLDQGSSLDSSSSRRSSPSRASPMAPDAAASAAAPSPSSNSNAARGYSVSGILPVAATARDKLLLLQQQQQQQHGHSFGGGERASRKGGGNASLDMEQLSRLQRQQQHQQQQLLLFRAEQQKQQASAILALERDHLLGRGSTSRAGIAAGPSLGLTGPDRLSNDSVGATASTTATSSLHSLRAEAMAELQAANDRLMRIDNVVAAAELQERQRHLLDASRSVGLQDLLTNMPSSSSISARRPMDGAAEDRTYAAAAAAASARLGRGSPSSTTAERLLLEQRQRLLESNHPSSNSATAPHFHNDNRHRRNEGSMGMNLPLLPQSREGLPLNNPDPADLLRVQAAIVAADAARMRRQAAAGTASAAAMAQSTALSSGDNVPPPSMASKASSQSMDRAASAEADDSL